MAKKEAKANNNKDKEIKNKKSFFKGFKAELKKVIWPTPKQLVNNTVAVITIVLITALIVFVLDLAFESINTYGIDKIKSVIETTNSEENATSEDSTNSSEETTNTTESTDEGASTENTESTESPENVENTENETNTENQENVSNTEAVENTENSAEDNVQ